METLKDKLVAAARTFGSREFSFEQLVVRAWTLDRKVWSLRGYEDKWPCSHKVMGILCGRVGPLACGYMRRVGKGRYANCEAPTNGKLRFPEQPAEAEVRLFLSGSRERAIANYLKRVDATPEQALRAIMDAFMLT